jgi:hypothetical protein
MAALVVRFRIDLTENSFAGPGKIGLLEAIPDSGQNKVGPAERFEISASRLMTPSKWQSKQKCRRVPGRSVVAGR